MIAVTRKPSLIKSMEEDLVVISRRLVTPRNADKSSCVKKKKKKIHLTPWDLARLRFGYLQRGLLFPKPDTNIDIIISRLQTSLSLALDHFYPLAGRLVKVQNQDDDDTVSFFITCDGSGVEFVHAVAQNIEVSDVLELRGSVPGFFSSFFPATGIKNYNGVTRSLLMVQVTEMKDGIFIGFGYNSTMADGYSIWKFVKAWSEICSKDSGSFEHPLDLKGWFFDEIAYPIHIPDPEKKATSYVTSSILQEKMLHFSKENVLKLEAKANDEANQKISSIQAVLGHIWCSMVKHNGMSREEVTHCRLPINMRGRLKPPLEEECFGNVSPTGIVAVTVGELLDHGLGWAALQIDEMERSQTDENAKTSAENWVKNAKVIPVSVGSKDLVVTNSHRYDVYCNDFGWGKPIAARAGPPYVNGRLVVYQGVEEGSLDFQVCLHPEVVEKMLMDVEFNKYVSIV